MKYLFVIPNVTYCCVEPLSSVTVQMYLPMSFSVGDIIFKNMSSKLPKLYLSLSRFSSTPSFVHWI